MTSPPQHYPTLDLRFIERVGHLATRLYRGGAMERDAAAVLHAYLRARERGPARLLAFIRTVGGWMKSIEPQVEALPDDHTGLSFRRAEDTAAVLTLAEDALRCSFHAADGFALKVLCGACMAIHSAEMLGMLGELTAALRAFERRELN